jgi:hypothetical protein
MLKPSSSHARCVGADAIANHVLHFVGDNTESRLVIQVITDHIAIDDQHFVFVALGHDAGRVKIFGW